MIKSNQYCIVWLVIICFVTDSVLSAAIASHTDDEVRVVTKVGEQIKNDALLSQQKDSENVAPIDPVLCKVPVDASRNVNEERVMEFQRNLREGRGPIVALITMPNESGKDTTIPVIVLRQDNANKNPIQIAWENFLNTINPTPAASSSTTPSNGIVSFFQNIFPVTNPVNPGTSNDEQPNQLPDIASQFGSAMTNAQSAMTNAQSTFAQSLQEAIASFQLSFTQAVSQATETFNSVVSNSVNTVQSNNQNLLSNLFNSTVTTTTTTPSSTTTSEQSEVGETGSSLDEPTNNEIVEKVGEEGDSTSSTTTMADSTTEGTTKSTTVKKEAPTTVASVPTTIVTSTTTAAAEDLE